MHICVCVCLCVARMTGARFAYMSAYIYAYVCMCVYIYIGFLRRLFVERTPAADAFKGLAWLFLGVATSEGLLYDDDWREVCLYMYIYDILYK